MPHGEYLIESQSQAISRIPIIARAPSPFKLGAFHRRKLAPRCSVPTSIRAARVINLQCVPCTWFGRSACGRTLARPRFTLNNNKEKAKREEVGIFVSSLRCRRKRIVDPFVPVRSPRVPLAVHVLPAVMMTRTTEMVAKIATAWILYYYRRIHHSTLRNA